MNRFTFSLFCALRAGLVVTACLLAACGGSDEPLDAPEQAASAPSTQPVDCRLHPEKCI